MRSGSPRGCARARCRRRSCSRRRWRASRRAIPAINAVVIRAFEEGRKAIEAGLPDGPFRGVPWLLKDLHAAWTGVRLTNGSRFFADNVSDYDSELVARYRRAGLVLFGRTASPEFGVTSTTESILYGETRNPWQPSHPRAALRAARPPRWPRASCPPRTRATAADRSASPPRAAACSGMKPTRARVPSGPKLGEGWSGMSVQHAVSRSVRDSAALLDAVAGPGARRSVLCAAARAAVPRRGGRAIRAGCGSRSRRAAFNGAEVDPDCVAAARDAAELCRSARPRGGGGGARRSTASCSRAPRARSSRRTCAPRCSSAPPSSGARSPPTTSSRSPG